MGYLGGNIQARTEELGNQLSTSGKFKEPTTLLRQLD